MFQGVYVAIVTPFDADGKVDYNALKELVNFHLEQGTDGIVPCGTTGESATLSHDEHKRVVELVVGAADGQCQVIAGTGSNSTAEAVDLTKHAKSVGADAALVITPYYNKPTQEGLYRHFKAISDAVDLPQVVYNVPGRTGVNMLPPTVERLSELPNVVAIKEASGNITQVSEITRTADLEVLSGDDAMTLPILSVGGVGVISVIGNLVPAMMKKMVMTWADGDHAEALAIHHKLQPLCEAMFIESNPIPLKTAMKLLGRSNGVLRLPLCEMQEANIPKLKAALTEFGMTQ